MTIEALDLRKSALIVVDLQNAFCHRDGTLGQSGVNTQRLSAIIPPLRSLIERCQEAGMPVFWTLQEHFEIDRRRGRKKLAPHTSRRKQLAAVSGSWDAAIVDELSDLVVEPSFVIRKHRFGAFYETRLDLMLQMLGIEAVFVTGTTTNACVETTIREAYLRDYDVVAVTDCISGVDSNWERVATEIWQRYFCVTADSASVKAWINHQDQPRPVYVHHLLLKVQDMQVSKHFYLDLLGFTERKDAKPLPDGRRFLATFEGLGLTEGASGDHGQMDHLAFEVHNVATLNKRLKAADVEFVRELGDGPYGTAIYVKDPNGYVLELFERDA